MDRSFQGKDRGYPRNSAGQWTPPQLLSLVPTAQSPAFRALQSLKTRWEDLDHPWGPGGSVGFELTTGKQVVNATSDLDIVIYAETRITLDEARSLQDRAKSLPAVVDIRVETPLCGFSMSESVRQNAGEILLRTPDGLGLGKDPWTKDH